MSSRTKQFFSQWMIFHEIQVSLKSDKMAGALFQDLCTLLFTSISGLIMLLITHVADKILEKIKTHFA
jgi:hypothetical protein